MGYLTEATSGQFRKYNYGVGKNRFLYGNDTPPEYDIKRIKVPIYVMYAAHDWSTTKEVSISIKCLTRPISLFKFFTVSSASTCEITSTVGTSSILLE